jgi:molybdopterin-guanine dinucleotide biosynthesis protein A
VIAVDGRHGAAQAEEEARADVCGVVLCGGASSRMGRDKATLALGGRTLLERAADCLSAVAAETVLAVGPRRRYGELGLTCVLDRQGDVGPAAGIRAALAAVDAEWFCVLACDMPRVDRSLFDALLARARRDELDCCFAVAREDLPEPVCAVYHRRCLAPMEAALAAGRRRVLAFLEFPGADGRALRSGNVPAAEPAGSAAGRERVLNLNTPEEWARERTRDGEGDPR